ncbi:MAG: Hsp20/alpha crystallin family protein [Armatimonadota bacterium]
MLPVTVRKPQFSAIHPSTPQPASDVDQHQKQPKSEDIGAYPVDIWEDQMSLIVEAELPGFNGDEVDVILGEDCLKLQADRKPQQNGGHRHLSERQFVRVQRQFNLPCPVDGRSANASLQDGILRLQLPKADSTHPAVIHVG